jgi:NADH:ubiquinone oxidoreductase subunit F (NADH-binding)/(2Fe-2S) ferredoxin
MGFTAQDDEESEASSGSRPYFGSELSGLWKQQAFCILKEDFDNVPRDARESRYMSLIELQQKAQAEVKSLRNGKTCIYIDTGVCGSNAGSTPVFEQLVADVANRKIDAQVIQTGAMGWREVEPVVAIAKPGQPRIYYRNVTPALVSELIENVVVGSDLRADLAFATDATEGLSGIPALSSLPYFAAQQRVLLRNAGQIDPENLNDALANGAYEGLAKALSMTPDAVIDEVEKAGLRGRGGAGFATAKKWRACRQAESDQHYVIANAAQGLESAGKDEVLLESDPHAVLEGLLIAAYATGANYAYLAINPDFHTAIRRAGAALEQMQKAQLVGEKILGTEFSCKIEISLAPRGLAGGEETILINALQGRQALSNVRPPYPETEGLHGKPTSVDNVESLALAAVILGKGSASFCSAGTKSCPGTKLVTLSGKLQRTGVAEVALGTSVSKIVSEIGGGVTEGAELKAVQVGGPAGGILPAAELNVALDYEELAKAGCTLGSGALSAADSKACIVDLAKKAATVAHQASCGKCTFGREGSRQLKDVLTDISKGRSAASDIDLLLDLSDGMKAGSLCANGKNAPDAVITALRYFRAEVEAHLSGSKQCPAKVCGNN